MLEGRGFVHVNVLVSTHVHVCVCVHVCAFVYIVCVCVCSCHKLGYSPFQTCNQQSFNPPFGGAICNMYFFDGTHL